MVARKYECLETRVNAIATRLNPIFRPEVVQQAIDEMGKGLTSTKRVRIRTPGGAVMYEEVPDTALRCAIAVKIVEFEYGKAVQRSITADVSPAKSEPTTADFMRSVMSDPVKLGILAETAQNIVEAAKKAQATEVRVTPLLTENRPRPPESQSGGSPR